MDKKWNIPGICESYLKEFIIKKIDDKRFNSNLIR